MVCPKYIECMAVCPNLELFLIPLVHHKILLVYCTHHNSYIPWTHQITWIKSLTPWISWICSPYKLSSGTGFIRKKELWNGFSSSHGLIKLHGSKVWHLGYHRYVLPVSYLLELVTSGNKHREMVFQNL